MQTQTADTARSEAATVTQAMIVNDKQQLLLVLLSTSTVVHEDDGCKEDVRASDHCSDQPVLDCPDARVVIHVFCLKMFSDWSNVQLQRTKLTHTH